MNTYVDTNIERTNNAITHLGDQCHQLLPLDRVYLQDLEFQLDRCCPFVLLDQAAPPQLKYLLANPFLPEHPMDRANREALCFQVLLVDPEGAD